jgi:hypothetical protein
VVLVDWIGRAIAAVWMTAAHAVGAAVRAVGKSARDLDPLHRRDGMGLTILITAIFVAATTWWGSDNVVSHLMYAVVGGSFGSVAWAVPLLLALLAWRFLRHPDRKAETGRLIIGGSALVIGTLGLVRIAHGTPSPANGADAMRAAGGLIGYAASGPLVVALTPWVATPLLAVLCGFGLLVLTGTPLHRVPNRLAELRAAGGDDAGAAANRKTLEGGWGTSGRSRSRRASTSSRPTRRRCSDAGLRSAGPGRVAGIPQRPARHLVPRGRYLPDRMPWG